MTIQTIPNNEPIIKPLEGLLNNGFEQSLDEVIKLHSTIGTIKDNDEQEVTIDEAILMVKLIESWIFQVYRSSFGRYASLMRHNYSQQLSSIFDTNPYKKFVHKGLYSESFEKEKESYPFFKRIIIPLTRRVKEYRGTIEESLLAAIKPFLVKEFLEALIKQPKPTIELLSIMHNYNDYNYHLQRFISVFEENLAKQGEDKNPLELITVCWLDETFFKEKAIPELKKRTLTEEQKEKAAIHNSYKDLVNNYYDYCLYYAFAETRCAQTASLIDTFFFYEKDDFDRAVAIMHRALLNNELLSEDEVDWEYDNLLDATKSIKPEWVDDRLLLIVNPFLLNDEFDEDDEWVGF